MSKDPVSDADGNEVGHLQQHCAAGKTNWVCTDVVTLRAGPHTERGTVVTTGIYRFNDISRFAVTGGTGAYENVRGFATLEDQGDAVLTLNLIP